MAIVDSGPANTADVEDPPPPDAPGDGDATTRGAKKLGPLVDMEILVPADVPGVLLVNPPALPPDGINPRTANGFNAAAIVAAGSLVDVSNDVNTVSGDAGSTAVSAGLLPADAGLSWATTLMPLVASTPAANAAVIMEFFLAVGIERCLGMLPLRALVWTRSPQPSRCPTPTIKRAERDHDELVFLQRAT